MGGNGSSGPSQAAINLAAFQAGAGGERWVDIQGQIPKYHDTALESWKAGQQQNRPMYGGGGGGFHMPSFHMPEMGGGGGADMQAQFDMNMQSQQDLIRQQEEERRRIEGQNRRDALYAPYLDAAGSATDFVNTEVNQEIANSRLLGIDYSITDEQKSTRINDYFATVWGEGQQSQLEALMREWGNPQGFEGFTVTRGDASRYGGTGDATEEQVTPGRGQRPTFLGQEDEEIGLGGGATILGM